MTTSTRTTHPHEALLRDLYATFASGDLPGFLSGCTDDVTFTVPGDAAVSGTYDRDTFLGMIGVVMERSAGTFQEDVLDVFANDDHGALLLHHRFERDGLPQAYETTHVVTFAGDKLASWREHPGSMTEFEAAWGPR
jgi:ketosteroid isomerase-like protein